MPYPVGVSQDWTRRYLNLLGFALADDDPLPPADLATLERITRAHLLTVPFESITSVLRRSSCASPSVPPLDAEAMLASWIDRRSGGLCFEVTEMVSRLLRALGYAAHPVLGRISFPGSHQSVAVGVDGVRYLVDVGNGAPFFEPVRAGDTVEIHRAGLAYRFRPEDASAPEAVVIQDRWIDEQWQPFCRYALDVPTAADRRTAYQQHHVRGGSWVVDNLVLVRCLQDEVWSFRDGTLSHFTADGKHTRQIEPSDYSSLAAELFTLPNLPIAEAVRALA
jgi:N-hydroxyarylamine O-acetyltransferase